METVEEMEKRAQEFLKDMEKGGEKLEERKKKVFSYLRKDKNLIIWGIFIIIAWFGYYIRTRNLPLLKDMVTGKYIPLALDPHAFLRYAKTILEKGSLPIVDSMRYYPWGYDNLVEFKLLSYFIVYLYKFLHFFNSALTIEKVHVLYPPIIFIFGLLFFFLLIRKLFDYKIALLGSLLLAIIPSYLYRTMAGFSDKEAFGMFFFFAALYFFVSGWQTKTKKSWAFGILAGLSTGLMGLVWGGLAFLVSIIGLFTLISFVFLKFKKNLFFSYVSWYVVFYLIMIIFRGYSLHSIIGVYFGAVAILALFVGLGNYLVSKFKWKNKIEEKFRLPSGFAVLIIVTLLGVLFAFFIMGQDLIFNQIGQIYNTLTTPFGNDRWQLTVAEAHQPYLTNQIGQFGWKFFWVYVLGSVVLVYNLLKRLNKKVRNVGVGVYVLFILGFSLSRYSQSSIVLNGVSFFSQKIMYFGTILLLLGVYLGYYLYIYKKDKEKFSKILGSKQNLLFVLIWFFILLVASRSAIRLLFIFSTIISILVAYLGVKLFDYSWILKKDWQKIGAWIILFLIFINPFSISSLAYGILDKGVIIEHSKRAMEQGKYTGPSYSQQWQIAGDWVRKNVPEDAVFSHWWDYGYWVQTGFNRTTVTDGGNAYMSLNHFMGRSVLTGQSEIEALEFLKAHEVTHFLAISDEIGKYPAFSSIGSDENWDRYSWMPPFVLDPRKTQETRDSVVHTYTGVSPIDWDFTYKGEFFPKGGSAILGFFIPTQDLDGTPIIQSPFVIVANNGQQKQIPLECVFFNGQELKFDQEGLKGCLQIIPKIDGETVNPIGAAIYVSEKVRRTNFARLYLFNRQSQNFKLVYNDDGGMPLSLYNGRIIGPLKIWEVSYPEYLKVPDHYYEDKLPNPNVTNVEGRY
tara:strand:+ start:672 stop:3383 length:2712 start_codon:yes stop_codon:yes gene_type:complete